MIEKIKRNIGLTVNFFNRKKKKKFSLVRFIRWAFRNYGKADESFYNPRFKKYMKVTK